MGKLIQKLALIISTWLLFVACSENLSPDDNTLVIGTFNIQWLGDGINDLKSRNEEHYKTIAEVIKNTGADILTLQEIENEAALKKLLTHLPGYSCKINQTSNDQNLALIYNSSIEIIEIQFYNELIVENGQTRPGLIYKARKKNFDWTGMVVHLKSTSSYDSTDELRAKSYELREIQANKLRFWSDSILNSQVDKDLIITGDFNDNPLKSKNDCLAPLASSDKIKFLTQELKSCKNPIWTSIDHVAISKELEIMVVPNSIRQYNFYDSYPDKLTEYISDHCPVLISIDLSKAKN
jgi:endonuclease/exonuclease/phosphatase family metal-dependent hydrolase